MVARQASRLLASGDCWVTGGEAAAGAGPLEGGVPVWAEAATADNRLTAAMVPRTRVTHPRAELASA
jgi:hypothetical protein